MAPFTLTAALQMPSAAKSADKSLEIRVGIVAFEDFRDESDRLELLLAELAAVSLDHLHEQAQLLDTLSRGKVVVFTLAPEPPHLCILDFADNLIHAAVQKGYRDAAGRSSGGMAGSSGHRRFRTVLGEPSFREISGGR